MLFLEFGNLSFWVWFVANFGRAICFMAILIIHVIVLTTITKAVNLCIDVYIICCLIKLSHRSVYRFLLLGNILKFLLKDVTRIVFMLYVNSI